jgi:Skp family chaperone for outer membrane proteins
MCAYPQSRPDKVGIVHIRQSIIQTKDGEKAWNDFRARFEAAQREMQKRQGEIQALEIQLQNSRNVMAPEAQQKLQREIESRRRGLERDSQEQEADFNQEQVRIVQNLKAKFAPVLGKYAQEHGFALIIDVSGPGSPVLFAADAVDITAELAKLYEELSPKAAPPAAEPKP